MKKFLILTAFFLIASKLFAQDCAQHVFMKKGRTIEMTTFNPGGNVMHKAVMMVDDITTANGTITATVSAQNYDRSGKLRDKNTVTYKCDNGTLNIDVSAMMPKQGNFQFSTAYFKYPPGMKAGDHFDNVNLSMQMNMGGKAIKTNVAITNRTQLTKKTSLLPPGHGRVLLSGAPAATALTGPDTHAGIGGCG